MDLMPSHTASFPIHCASFIGHIYYWVKLFTISDIRPIYLWQKITVGKLHSILILFRPRYAFLWCDSFVYKYYGKISWHLFVIFPFHTVKGSVSKSCCLDFPL